MTYVNQFVVLNEIKESALLLSTITFFFGVNMNFFKQETKDLYSMPPTTEGGREIRLQIKGRDRMLP